MACYPGLGFMLSAVFAFLLSCCSFGLPSIFKQDIRNEFYSHDVVEPAIYTEAREKRDIRSTKVNDEKLALVFVAFGKDFVIDLRMNTDLLPEHYFEKHQENGSLVINQPMKKGGSHCHYQGHVKGCNHSWAAISTCDGISGVIYDGNELHFIEPHHLSNDERHFVFKASDMKPQNLTCGVSPSGDFPKESQILEQPQKPQKRERSVLRPRPYKSSSSSRYVELVIVNDNEEFKKFNENKTAVFERSKMIANILNGLYSPLNISIALVGVIVWSDHDEISLSSDADRSLIDFLQYRRKRLAQEHPNDNAQLITAKTFDGGAVARALKGTICTHEYSAGVNMDHSYVLGVVATTIAHTLGHNFGMEHDTAECQCPDDRCIMAASSSTITPRHWSSCSREYLELSYSHGMDYCLKNPPSNIIGPVCGNGFLEEGEECDCGIKEFCENVCCNATSCQLFPRAVCATGDCCDFDTCQMKNSSTLCRDVVSECDLEEYCDGVSEFCPRDRFLQNGLDCAEGKTYCFDGQCRSHTDQCKLLWGETGEMSDFRCYAQNDRGTRQGNCGYDRLNQTYTACEKDDVLCGTLHCVHFSEQLQFGLESASILSSSFINAGGKILVCRSAIVDLGYFNTDPGLVPNGAKCGDGKACVNQTCVPVSIIQQLDCPSNCTGNRVCNNEGDCQCKNGYSSPYCDSSSPGGSIDDGPVSNQTMNTSFLSRCKSRFFALFAW